MAHGKNLIKNADGARMIDKYLTVKALRHLLAELPDHWILRPNDITRNLVIYPDEDGEMTGWIDFGSGSITDL